MAVPGRCLENCMLDCFCIAHTPHLLGIDVPFGDYDLLPNFCVTGFKGVGCCGVSAFVIDILSQIIYLNEQISMMMQSLLSKAVNH